MKHVFTLLAFALMSSGQAQLPSYVPTEDLVAWYPFSGNANDESGYQNHGSVVGATLTMDRFGNENGAYHFDGSNHIEADHQSWLNSGLGSKTWAGWGRKTSGNDHAHFMTKIVATSGPYTAEATYLRFGPTNEIEFAEGQSWIGGNSVWTVVGSVLNDWVHLVGVKDVDSGNVRVYLNGVLMGEEQIQFPELEADNEGSLFIGCEHPYVSLPSGPQYFYGDLDELGIWNRALTEEEILSLYLSESLIQGCMDPMSCNFNPEAEEDDGSCLPYDSTSGCTDSVACNYNSSAVCDDGSCIYPPLNLTNCDDGEVTCGAGTYWDMQSQSCVVANPSDTDFDGCVGMIDLLDLLSVFGTCAESELEEVEWTCGDPLGYQGYDYATVLIGEQCWFAENLRATSYRNGEGLLSGLGQEEWLSTSEGALASMGEAGSSCQHYHPDFDACDQSISLSEFGLLYNGYAVGDERGVCPSGWKIPSDEDFMVLESHLGMAESELNDFDWRGTDEGVQMKSIDGWSAGGTGVNSSGFNGKSAGYRRTDSGAFNGAGYFGNFWTSTSELEGRFNRKLDYAYDGVKRNLVSNVAGYSIRCIKDSE